MNGQWRRVGPKARDRLPWIRLAHRFLGTCEKVLTLSPESSDPDGAEFQDFLVMGRRRGKNRLLLLRWVEDRDPVGRELVEECAAEGIRRKAHLCVVCTRGSFEKDAVYLATLRDVTLIRALPAVRRSRFVRDFAVLAKFLEVDNWTIRLYRSPDDAGGQVFDVNSPALSHGGSLVSNWLRGESIKLLQRCDISGLFEAKYVLDSPQFFLFSRKKVLAERMEAWISCRVDYAYQVDSMAFEGAQSAAASGARTPGMRVYPPESWIGLEFSRDNPPDPNHLRIVFLQPVPGNDGMGTSKLNRHVRSRSVRFVT